MKKLKSFFKKHYKRFVTISVTACLCFCFLFLNVSAIVSNSEFQIINLDMNYVTLTQVSSLGGTATAWEIRNPSFVDGFTYSSWKISKPFSIDEGTILSMNFEQNMRYVIPNAYFSVTIPFGLYFIKDSVPNLSSVTNCVFEFNYLMSDGQWNTTPTLVYCDLDYSSTGSNDIVALIGEAKFNLPLPNSYIFKEFAISLSGFNGSVKNGTSYAFAFRGPIKLIHSYSLTDQEVIDEGLSEEEYAIINATSLLSNSVHTIFDNVKGIIPVGIKTSLMVIRAIWLNLFNKVTFVYPLFHFSIALGIFGFIVGMSSIVIGALSRSNSRRDKKDYYKSRKGGK